MLSTNQFKLEHPKIFSIFRSFIIENTEFPCIHAKVSLQKKLTYFGISEHAKVDHCKVAKDLSEMACFLDSVRTDDEMSFNTYVHIIPNHRISNVTLFLLDCLQSLHDLDKFNWPEHKTKDMNSQNFAFYYNKKSTIYYNRFSARHYI